MTALTSVASLRQKLWQAGFRPLAVWSVEADRKRGKTTQAGKHPYGPGWQNLARQNPPHDAHNTPVADATNTGILCDGLRAIDFDIDDPAIANDCLQIALEIFPGALCRWRANSPRKLLLLRAAEGEPPKITLAGTRGKIELLGCGQQFVAFGLHESGAELRWTDAPGDVRLADVPAASEDDAQTLLERCAPILGATGAAQRANGEDHEPGEPQADSLRIAAALAFIPNDGPPDWEKWNKVGMAVWRATGGSSAGWEAFNAWSRRNPAYDAKETRERWSHYPVSPPTQIGAGTIFYIAKQHGWRDPQQTDEPDDAPAIWNPWEDPPPPAWPNGVLSQSGELALAEVSLRDGIELGALAMTIITAASAAAPKDARLAPYGNDWVVPPIIWLMTVGDSGTRKTRIDAFGFATLYAVHVELWRPYHARMKGMASHANKRARAKASNTTQFCRQRHHTRSAAGRARRHHPRHSHDQGRAGRIARILPLQEDRRRGRARLLPQRLRGRPLPGE
jgi:hypothetical protein